MSSQILLESMQPASSRHLYWGRCSKLCFVYSWSLPLTKLLIPHDSMKRVHAWAILSTAGTYSWHPDQMYQAQIKKLYCKASWILHFSQYISCRNCRFFLLTTLPYSTVTLPMEMTKARQESDGSWSPAWNRGPCTWYHFLCRPEKPFHNRKVFFIAGN